MSAHSHRPKATEQTAKPTQEAPFFQAKLTVNTPGDAYEQEADAVADQVMRMQEGDAPIVQRMPLTSIGDVQRKCAACEQEEEQQAQRKETGGGDASGKAAPGIVSDVLSSGAGRPMEGDTRQFMESRFGQDFSQVRVHTDSRAAESASAIQARAYTSGRDIVFGAGQYQPESEGGKRLLAHELAHVGQQGGGVMRQSAPEALTRYSNCSQAITGDAQFEVKIDNALRRAINFVGVAISALRAHDVNDKNYMQALSRHFAGPNRAERRQILSTFRAILSDLQTETNFRCDSPHPAAPNAQAYWIETDDLIHINPPFFRRSINCRAIILIHEAAHDNAINTEGNHTPNRGDAEYPTGSVGLPEGETVAARMTYPDSYAFFAAQIWRSVDTESDCFVVDRI